MARVFSCHTEAFTINVPDCYIRVIKPDRHWWVEFSWGGTIPIEWMTYAPATAVSIDLYRDGELACNITPATENDGEYE